VSTIDLTPDFHADRLNLTRGRRDGGISYARRQVQVEKFDARNRVLHHFRQSATGGRNKALNILTMPGLDWRFERALIADREHGRGRIRPRSTFITAIESSHPVYIMGLRKMPGADASLSTAVSCPPWARAAAKSYTIMRYFLTTFESLAANEDRLPYDGAWIDLTGPITVPRLEALGQLWRRIRRCLIVTSLNARWPANAGAEIANAGGLAEALMERMDGALATENFVYRDTSPMSQITFHRLYGEVS
jgi:hypothetical protein